jgi:hypothetical protein
VKWKRVDLPFLDGVVGSGQTYLLPSEQWPEWARGNPQFRRIAVYCPDPASPLASTATTAAVIARMITERYDERDWPKPYNYNAYLVVESTRGDVYQSEPIRPAAPPHHSSGSTWLDGLEPPPS